MKEKKMLFETIVHRFYHFTSKAQKKKNYYAVTLTYNCLSAQKKMRKKKTLSKRKYQIFKLIVLFKIL